MKEGEDNWVDMQVPDGTDWIEYMLRVAPDASHKTLGVMNHIALGVSDIHAAQQQLIKNGWKSTEEPKIGRDGKWQLNLYDPDETRVELMEFKPTKETVLFGVTPGRTPHRSSEFVGGAAHRLESLIMQGLIGVTRIYWKHAAAILLATGLLFQSVALLSGAQDGPSAPGSPASIMSVSTRPTSPNRVNSMRRL